MTNEHGKTEEECELITTVPGVIPNRDYFYGIENTKWLIWLKSIKETNSNIKVMLKLLLWYSEVSPVAMISNA